MTHSGVKGARIILKEGIDSRVVRRYLIDTGHGDWLYYSKDSDKRSIRKRDLTLEQWEKLLNMVEEFKLEGK